MNSICIILQSTVQFLWDCLMYFMFNSGWSFLFVSIFGLYSILIARAVIKNLRG